ncbi:MAG: hypothetical protein WCJ84_03260 [Candidatus Peregrinibacteria bacterium]
MASQIRITKTQEFSEVLAFLQEYYKGMTENEIIKQAVIQDYRTKSPFEIFPAEKVSPALQKEIHEALEEVKRGEVSGPFESADDFILSLKK